MSDYLPNSVFLSDSIISHICEYIDLDFESLIRPVNKEKKLSIRVIINQYMQHDFKGLLLGKKYREK